MKKMYLKNALIIILVLLPSLIFAQDLLNQIDDWKDSLKIVARSFVGLVAIGGGVYVYMKMSNSDGDSGKKALLNFLGSLIFAALMWAIIEFFI